MSTASQVRADVISNSPNGDTDQVYIIAEAGVNHNGSAKQAERMIGVAAAAGADAVKFQVFKADQVMTRTAPKAAYQQATTGAGESQFEMVKRLELDRGAIAGLPSSCQARGIDFLATPFDVDSVNFLHEELDVPRIKSPSGEITNAPYLLHLARTGKPVILSTGMSSLADVERALGVLAFGYTSDADATPSIADFEEAYRAGQEVLREKVTLLHCTSEYPAPFRDVNLRAMDTLATAFGLRVGLSDHTQGISIPIAAAARGAAMIEKHFTLDRGMPGPDHQSSLEPEELNQMVEGIRQACQALGSARKWPAPSEFANREIVRRSLVAARPIREGERFTPENVAVKRPGSGQSPFLYWSWMERTAERDYEPDELLR